MRLYKTKQEELDGKFQAILFVILFLGSTVFAEFFDTCYERFQEYDVLLTLIASIIIIFWIVSLVNDYKKRKRIRDVVFYEPPKNMTAAEVAAIDAWGPTGRVFPAMLYDWVAKKNVKMGIKPNGEIYFEKLTDNPFFFSDAKYIYSEHNAYNRDPEDDFWKLCFVNRNCVTLKMLSRIPMIEKLPHDFFYQVQRQCLDWDTYKKKKRPLLNTAWETALWIPFSIGCLITGISLSWYFVITLGLAGCIRIFSLKFLSEENDKYRYLTNQGVKIFEEVKGFKKYLLAVEDSKLKVVLKQDPTYFEKILPYAIALGIGDGWIHKCFKHLQYDEFGGLVSDGTYQGFRTLRDDTIRDGILNSLLFSIFTKTYTRKK